MKKISDRKDIFLKLTTARFRLVRELIGIKKLYMFKKIMKRYGANIVDIEVDKIGICHVGGLNCAPNVADDPN